MSQKAMRVFSTAFKESAVLRLADLERLAEVARDYGDTLLNPLLRKNCAI
jgi:hypothetical protein